MRTERTGAVLTAVLLVLSAVGGVATAATAGGAGDRLIAQSDGDETVLNETTSNADEAYVTDDGSVVLVYTADESADTENVSGHASVNVSDGFAEFLVRSESGADATGDLSLLATPDRMSADGSLVADRPDALTNLRFELDSVQNRTVSESEMELNSTIALPQDSETAAISMFLQGARTSGTMTSDSTSLAATGSAEVNMGMQLLPDRSHEFVLTEDDGTYTLEVEESYQLTGNAIEDWETRDEAKATLEEQYCEGAAGADVTCEVSLEEYALTDAESSGGFGLGGVSGGDSTTETAESKRLDIEYTVTAQEVDAAISEMIVAGLSESEEGMTESDASELADRIENVTLSRVEAKMAVESGQTGQQAGISWNVSLDGTDDLTLAYVDLLEQFEQAATNSPQAPDTDMTEGMFGTSMTGTVEQLRKQTEARQAAGLETTSSWDFALTTGLETVNLNGTATTETTNWADYVSELDDRDVNITDSTRMTADVRTDGDRITGEMSASVEDENMFDRALQQYNRSADEPEVTQAVETLRAADFERARLDANVTEESAAIAGELSFGNGAALSDGLPEPFSMMQASEMDLESGQMAMLMDANADDEDTVRNLAYVNDDTNVNMPEEWDREAQSFGSFAASDSVSDTDDSDESDNTDESNSDGADENGAESDDNSAESDDNSAESDDNRAESDDNSAESDDTDGETTDATTEDTGDGDGPGFGLVPALIGAVGGAAIAGKRLRGSA